ncbi:MAG: hypothetical protein H6Q37_1951, partial [Chloroflexi bacterium]|nr:hypothetical protein [Chloroflexota bacterium]
PSFDIDNQNRPNNGKDIGADELGAAPLAALAAPISVFSVSLPMVMKSSQ